jgi:putative transposase
MIQAHLTPEQRSAVQALRCERTLRPAERDRIEMILLSAAGWSPPRIAAHLGCHPATVRQTIKRFTAEGLASLPWRQPGPPKDLARRHQVTALDRLLGQERTWTAAQLAEALPHLPGRVWLQSQSTLHAELDPRR